MISAVSKDIYGLYPAAMRLYKTPLIENTIGMGSFIWGVKGIYYIDSDFHLALEAIKNYKTSKDWKAVALRVIDLLGDFSIIGGALTSKPVLCLGKAAIKILLKPAQVEALFKSPIFLCSRYAYYAVKITFFVIGVPSNLKLAYTIFFWLKRKACQLRQAAVKGKDCHQSIK